MDEVYWAAYAWQAGLWQQQGEISLDRPEAVVAAPGWALAGTALVAYADRLPQPAVRLEALPTAAALLRLAPALLAAGLAVPAAHAMPLYIRDKVAQTTEERASRRAAQSAIP
jgi:tRNA threonylcarbamoyladenosine biosynthesis protein TsaB